MTDEGGFWRAIQENPADDAARLVYADWLEERGDIRGEYLRLEHQLANISLRLAQLREQIDQDWLASVSKRRQTSIKGTWGASDDRTEGLLRLDIGTEGQTWTIRAWTECDVRNEEVHRLEAAAASGPDHMPLPFVPPALATLHLLADDVCDAEMRYGIASWDHGFMNTHLTLRLEGDELIAEDFNVFKDHSGRSNYRGQYKFKKVK
jgi:uncharacterized protein (TIGR02996 family)